MQNTLPVCAMLAQPQPTLAMKLSWTALFSYRFVRSKHINLLELASVIGLLRRITREGIRTRRILVLVDSRVVLGSCLERTIMLTKSQFLASEAGFLVSCLESRWNWCGCRPGEPS